MAPKAQATKATVSKWDEIKLKRSVQQKKKKPPTTSEMGENICLLLYVCERVSMYNI